MQGNPVIQFALKQIDAGCSFNGFEMKENQEMKSCGDFPVKDFAGSNFGSGVMAVIW